MSLDPALYPPIPAVETGALRPFWSVIVPAYKAKYLSQALHSVIDQAPPPDQMEIIVINDCSPEDLEPIVRQVAGDRVIYLRQSENRGTYPTENAAVTMSRGHWIHILNDDDWVLPGFYEIFQQSLENQSERIGAAFCGFTNYDENGLEISTSQPIQGVPGVIPNFIDQIGVSQKLHPICAVFRRSCFERLGGFNLNLNYCADWEFNKRVAAFYDWWYEPRVLAGYRVNSSGVSLQTLQTGQQLRDLGHAIDLSEKYLPPDRREKITAAAREHYAMYALRVAAHGVQQQNFAMVLTQVKQGLKLSRSPKVLDRLVQLIAIPAAGPLREALARFFERVEVAVHPPDDSRKG